MPETKEAKKAFYVVLGAGQFAIDRATGLVKAVRGFLDRQRKDAGKNYRDLAKRGEKIVTSIQRSAPVKRATGQTVRKVS